jgi:hypothetical protein
VSFSVEYKRTANIPLGHGKVVQHPNMEDLTRQPLHSDVDVSVEQQEDSAQAWVHHHRGRHGRRWRWQQGAEGAASKAAAATPAASPGASRV